VLAVERLQEGVAQRIVVDDRRAIRTQRVEDVPVRLRDQVLPHHLARS